MSQRTKLKMEVGRGVLPMKANDRSPRPYTVPDQTRPLSAFFLREDGPCRVLLSSKFMLTLITKVTLLLIFLRIQ